MKTNRKPSIDMNLNYKQILIAGLLLLPVLSSCSIKEDRGLCPCILTLDYSKISGDGRYTSAPSWDSLLVRIPNSYCSVVRVDEQKPLQTICIPRVNTQFSCYFGMTMKRIDGDFSRLTIPLGEDSDRLFSYHRPLLLSSESEEEFVIPELCAESTRIVIEFDEQVSLPSDGILIASGSCCGMNLNTGKPLRGEFLCTLKPYGNMAWTFNMPRQGSKDIKVSVVSSVSKNLIFDIDLARELDDAGYDWDAESLSPLVIVHINSMQMSADVKIIDWDQAIYFNYTL